MNVQQTTEIRELTALEVEQVTGGFNQDVEGSGRHVTAGVIGGLIGVALYGLLDWLFDL